MNIINHSGYLKTGPRSPLSKLGDKVSLQNAEMLSVLLTKNGVVKFGHGDNLEQLSLSPGDQTAIYG